MRDWAVGPTPTLPLTTSSVQGLSSPLQLTLLLLPPPLLLLLLLLLLPTLTLEGGVEEDAHTSRR
jgi:hypothetical protein